MGKRECCECMTIALIDSVPEHNNLNFTKIHRI